MNGNRNIDKTKPWNVYAQQGRGWPWANTKVLIMNMSIQFAHVFFFQSYRLLMTNNKKSLLCVMIHKRKWNCQQTECSGTFEIWAKQQTDFYQLQLWTKLIISNSRNCIWKSQFQFRFRKCSIRKEFNSLFFSFFFFFSISKCQLLQWRRSSTNFTAKKKEKKTQ